MGMIDDHLGGGNLYGRYHRDRIGVTFGSENGNLAGDNLNQRYHRTPDITHPSRLGRLEESLDSDISRNNNAWKNSVNGRHARKRAQG